MNLNCLCENWNRILDDWTLQQKNVSYLTKCHEKYSPGQICHDFMIMSCKLINLKKSTGLTGISGLEFCVNSVS